MQKIFAASVGVIMLALIAAELAGWRGLRYDRSVNRLHVLTLIAAGMELAGLAM